jgi:hypothetical protein
MCAVVWVDAFNVFTPLCVPNYRNCLKFVTMNVAVCLLPVDVSTLLLTN